MIVIDKLVVSNKEPENKYVIWYSPVTKETYRWFKDGWEKISVDSCKILEAIETVKDVVIETHETVLNLESFFNSCSISIALLSNISSSKIHEKFSFKRILSITSFA